MQNCKNEKVWKKEWIRESKNKICTTIKVDKNNEANKQKNNVDYKINKKKLTKIQKKSENYRY